MNASRIELGIYEGWAKENPDLFGKSILRLLEEHPAEDWEITIEQAWMPGQKWSFVAVPRNLIKAEAV